MAWNQHVTVRGVAFPHDSHILQDLLGPKAVSELLFYWPVMVVGLSGPTLVLTGLWLRNKQVAAPNTYRFDAHPSAAVKQVTN